MADRKADLDRDAREIENKIIKNTFEMLPVDVDEDMRRTLKLNIVQRERYLNGVKEALFKWDGAGAAMNIGKELFKCF